ncbi:MAG TPA: hypothetical protein DCL61_16615 [Cyanobacteria bacterium UBA12227]|nr:hypothetical protein [Cyanobacteria bacterium UBA12227]HAX87928.1 hypothetical protein [Cyanobacteria bacterium UBA11370]HBY80818.1 hypothetical protein [Cyanobacteria bacterium UBA11148]
MAIQISDAKLSWFEVPEDVKHLLVLASDSWDNSIESERYVNEALKKSGNNLDVLVGAYRYFFYKNKIAMALHIAEKVMAIIKQDKKLPESWQQLKPVLISRKNDPIIRLYLNAYAAKGLILAKLGNLEEAKEITERIKEIDEKRESCATTVFEVLTRSPNEDDD